MTSKKASVDLAKAYLARIAQVNPVLHIMNEVNPDALTIAAELDALRANGTTLGPLHGIPSSSRTTSPPLTR
jgi:amidase